MQKPRRWVQILGGWAGLALVGGWLLVVPVVGQSAPAAPVAAKPPAEEEAAPESARTWIGREVELEAYLKSVEPESLEPIGVGVTNPHKAMLPAGGPVGAFAWKPLKPGFYNGFYESYKSEIAAYELDKLLGLGMVPVTVERRVHKQLGAASMWVSPSKSFKDLGGPPRPPAAERDRWYMEVSRAKMFDNLINNQDPNLGNWLKDPAWNLMKIDHSRAFAAGKAMAHEMKRVDADLWERMLALTEESLSGALGEWLNKKQIKGMLKRRDRMKEIVAGLVAEKGEEAVLVRLDE